MTNPNGLVVPSTVTVDPGPTPTMLLSRMPAGTQIVNLSTTDSIWVSDNPSVTPSIGWELGPQGSLVWQYDQQAAYSCVDTGVVSPVAVTFGNSVSDIQNPVFVAQAMAILGIPNVLVEDALPNVVLAAGATSAFIDVSRYASLFLGNNTAASITGWKFQYVFYDPNFNQLGLSIFGVPADPSGIGFTCPSYQIPVAGKYIKITNNSASAATLFMTGTNRLCERAMLATDILNMVAFQQTFAWVNGADYNLGMYFPSAPKDGQISMDVTFAPAVRGLIRFYDINGIEFQIIDDTQFHVRADTFKQALVNLQVPPLPVQVSFHSFATVAAALVSVIIMG